MNRFLASFLSFLWLACSFNAWASQVDVVDTLSVLKVNNKPQSINFFSRSTTLELGEGKHILLLQYNELFENFDEDDHVTIKSEPFVLLVNIKENEHYRLEHEVLSEVSAARGFAEKPEVTLLNQAEKPVEIFTQNLVDFEARAIFNSMDTEVETIKNTPSAIEVKETNKADVENKQAYEMLKYWWEQSSNTQKKQFIEYIKAK